jgi:ABC-type nitrate/sulfonate/bicarbonate transport system ATPase subunit
LAAPHLGDIITGIKVENLGKAYPLPGGRRKIALQDVQLEIQSGEFVCLLGPSGCGKTTLLNILSSLDRDYQGTVKFLSQSTPTERGRNRKPIVSYMFQESRLLPWLTVRENIRFVLDAAHASEARQRIERWLQRVGLEGHGDYYPMQLSVGMQQRVAVARALIIEPELLFMDEPFSSLDELTALNMRKELLELWREQRCTVVFVTHNPLEAVYLADRVMIMTPGPGHILEEINVAKLLPRPRDSSDQRLWELSRQAVQKLMGEKAGFEEHERERAAEGEKVVE